MFGPLRRRAPHGHSPYADPQSKAEVNENFMQSFDITELDSTQLPDGWHMDTEGAFYLTNDPMDYWEVKAGCVIRHHLRPRRALFRLQEHTSTPVAQELLDAGRTTVIRRSDGKIELISDRSDDSRYLDSEWTGCTIFQISGKARRELGMFANLPAKKVGRTTKAKMTKASKPDVVNERHLSAADRAKFQEAKCKELASFFENRVWEFSSTKEATPERTMTARMLTKWSKNAVEPKLA